jgi:hypothetical protein
MENPEFYKKFKEKFSNSGSDFKVIRRKKVAKAINSEINVNGTTINKVKNNLSDGNISKSRGLADVKLPAIKQAKRMFLDKDLGIMNERKKINTIYSKKTGSSFSCLPKKLNFFQEGSVEYKNNQAYNFK